MADFFAHYDVLEPALGLVSEVLRNKENVGEVMKMGATFLSLAQPLEKLRSASDHDVVETDKPERTVGPKRTKGLRMLCFSLQRGACKFRGYSHECSLCGSRCQAHVPR